MGRTKIHRKAFLLALLRSRAGHVALAGLAVALSCGLAWAVWQWRDFVAALACGLLLLFGAELAGELWPMSEKDRDAWRRTNELRKRYLSFRLRRLLWFGAGLSGLLLWHILTGNEFQSDAVILPGLLMALGGAAELVWRVKHRQGEKLSKAQ